MIKNKTKKTVITGNFSTKKGFAIIKGLIGEKNQKAIVFKTRFGIHTFLLRFPIDVIILDKNKKAVILKKELKPNSIFVWNIKYDTVVELPAKSIEKSKTEIGDILQLTS